MCFVLNNIKTNNKRICCNKLVEQVLYRRFFHFSNQSGSSAEATLPCKYGILMEKTSAISIQFLYDQGFRKVGNFSNFVVMEMEITPP